MIPTPLYLSMPAARAHAHAVLANVVAHDGYGEHGTLGKCTRQRASEVDCAARTNRGAAYCNRRIVVTAWTDTHGNHWRATLGTIDCGGAP